MFTFNQILTSWENRDGLAESIFNYFNEFTKILLLSETHRRPIGNILEGDPSETDMPDRRPIGDLNMLHQRPTCLIRDLDMLHQRPTCIGDLKMLHLRPTCHIGNPLETEMLHLRSNRIPTCLIIGDRHD